VVLDGGWARGGLGDRWRRDRRCELKWQQKWQQGQRTFGPSGTVAVKMHVAEADGDRTRLRALALTPVLKTGGPTRRPDASGGEDTLPVPLRPSTPFARTA
jgi:hypothetical protein